jgi:hypothetical protein
MNSKHPPWVGPFLDHLRTSLNAAESCRAAGVAYSSMTNLRSRDADFAAAFDDALEQAYDHLEAEARRRAFEGVDEPVFHQGEVVGRVRRYSDGLAQFLLKGYRRRKFGDKQEITGADGGPLAMVDETKKAARVAALLAMAQARKDSALPADDDVSDLA